MHSKAIALGWPIALTVVCTAVSAARGASIQDVARLTKGYMEAVACETSIASIKVAKIAGIPRPDGQGDVYVAVWVGDLGCAGGSGTTGPHFNVFTTETGDSIVINPGVKFPDVAINEVSKLYSKGNVLVVEGLGHGPHDSQAELSKKVRVTLTYVTENFGDRSFKVSSITASDTK